MHSRNQDVLPGCQGKTFVSKHVHRHGRTNIPGHNTAFEIALQHLLIWKPSSKLSKCSVATNANQTEAALYRGHSSSLAEVSLPSRLAMLLGGCHLPLRLMSNHCHLYRVLT